MFFELAQHCFPSGNPSSYDPDRAVQILDTVGDFDRIGNFRAGFDLNGDFQAAFGRINSWLRLNRHKARYELGSLTVIGTLGVSPGLFHEFQLI